MGEGVMRKPLALTLLAVLLLGGPVSAGKESKEALARFRERFASTMTPRTRLKAIAALTEVAEKEVFDGFEWGFKQTAKEVRRLLVEKDDELENLRRLEKEIADIQRRAHEQGKEPMGPASLKQAHDRARQKVERLQKHVDREFRLRTSLAEALGPWRAGLPAEDRADVLKDLERKHLRGRDWAARVFYLRGLSKAAANEVTRLLLVRLAEEKDRRVLPIVIDALAEQAGELAVPELVPLLSDARWQIRVATVKALERIGRPAAIQPLIDRLRDEPGRVRGDIADALKALTGQDLGIEPDRWQKWWDANRDGCVPPEKVEPAPEPEPDPSPPGGKPGDVPPEKPGPPDSSKPEEPAPPDSSKPVPPPPGGGASFYGIRVVSKRIIFVIDMSGSMNDPASGKDQKRTKIAVAKHELKNAVLGLPDDARLNIVLYSESVSTWKKGMVKAVRKERVAAVEFVEKQDALGGTNIHDALEKAFNIAGRGARDKNYEQGADTIFFLSDGQPTVGTVIDPVLIANQVKRWNAGRRVKIHTVGVGADHDAAFMQELAESSGGTYVKR